MLIFNFHRLGNYAYEPPVEAGMTILDISIPTGFLPVKKSATGFVAGLFIMLLHVIMTSKVTRRN